MADATDKERNPKTTLQTSSSLPSPREPLRLIAAIDWDVNDDDDVVVPRFWIRRLRVNANKVTRRVTGLALRQELECYIRRQNIDSSKAINNIENWTIQLYDPELSTYVTVADDQTDVLKRFGARVRMRIQVSSSTTNFGKERLALQGRYYANDFVNGRMTITMCDVDADDGHLTVDQGDEGRNPKHCKEIFIQQDPNQSETGVSVWDGAILMVRFLEQHASYVNDQHVVELGAGCGLVGIAAAALGAKNVRMTDLDYCMPLLRQNIGSNRHLWPSETNVDACPCDWFLPPPERIVGPHSPPVDLLIAADCVWLEELVEPFLSTLEAISHAHKKAQILLTYQRRGKATDQAFWDGLRKRFRRVEVLSDVDERADHDLYIPPVLKVISCQR